MRLPDTLAAWGTPVFGDVFKAEVEALGAAQLPLQQGLTTGSHALERRHQVMILEAAEREDTLEVKAGIFYAGIIAGCSCADDPTPVEETVEYCEVLFRITTGSGETTATLLT